MQTLTLQPTVVDGVIQYEDSPLVRAVRHGHILVVDEADKAPTHVTCILKTLVESGEMHLADGRRIVHGQSCIYLPWCILLWLALLLCQICYVEAAGFISSKSLKDFPGCCFVVMRY